MAHRLRSFYSLGLLVAFALVAGVRGAAAQPELKVAGDHFTVNGQAKFLILLSYFDGLRSPSPDSDFILIKSLNIDGIRIFPNWWNYTCPSSGACSRTYRSDTLITSSGAYSTTRLNDLKTLLDKAGAKGLVVDLTFTRDTVCSGTGAPPCGSPLGVPSYSQQIEDVLAALASEPARFQHVFVDFQNERDLNRPEQDLSTSETMTLADWAQTTWPSRPVTASTTNASGTNGSAPGSTQAFVSAAHLDVAAYHDARGTNWQLNTGGIVDALRSSGVPVYLQEPTPFGTHPERDEDSDASHFYTAVNAAKSHGAAAWTFHSRSAFNLSLGSYAAQASSAEQTTASNLALQAGSTWGACVATATPSAFSLTSSDTSIKTINIGMNAGCSWAAAIGPSTPWIHFTGTTTGSGNGGVDFRLDANTGATRSGTITVGGQVVTISQGAAPTCVPTVGPTSLSVWPSTTTENMVSVTMPAGCAWSGTSNSPWLTVTAGSSGTGNGTVKLTALANATAAARTGSVTIAGVNVPVTQRRRWVPQNFDTDRRADLTVYRPSTGWWWIQYSSKPPQGYGFGLSSDLPYAIDIDGDQQAELAVWRPSEGKWYITRSSTGFTDYIQQQWGVPGDIPVADDYDGDGYTDLAVYRPLTGWWWILYTSKPYQGYGFGLSTDIPYPVDYDGDGKADLAVWRPSEGKWYITTSSTGYTDYQIIQWGLPGDIPAAADFDGDGRTDLTVYRPSTGWWWIQYSSKPPQGYGFGLSSDNPHPLDYDGDGKADIAVWRPSSGEWYLTTSSTGYTDYQIIQWGLPGDTPLVRAR